MHEAFPDLDLLDLLFRCARGDGSARDWSSVEKWLGDDQRRHTLFAAVAAMAREPNQLDERFDAIAARRRLRRAIHRETTVPPMPPRRRWGRRRSVASVLAAALCIFGIGVGAWEIRRAREAAMIASARRISIVAPKGRVESVRLPDGTRVALAPTSVLWYSATFGRAERDVHLEGEAHFAVAHDSSKRFTVFARNGVARDIGTEFTVRAYADDREVSIVVAEGRVAVGTGRPASIETSSVILGPGDAWRLARDGQAHVDRADVARATAWMRGVLAFDGAPLAEVRVELSRWFDVRLELADESLASRRLTGTFTSASVADFLAAIGPALNVRYETQGNRILLSAVPRGVNRTAPDGGR